MICGNFSYNYFHVKQGSLNKFLVKPLLHNVFFTDQSNRKVLVSFSPINASHLSWNNSDSGNSDSERTQKIL